MDPAEKAAVHARVINMCGNNSKTGKEALPPRRAKRKNADSTGPSSAEIADAQEALDSHERYRTTLLTEHRSWFKCSEWAKGMLTTLEKHRELDVHELCRTIGVMKGEYYRFVETRKKQEMYESKVYHEAVPYLRRRAEESTGKENKRPRLEQEEHK